MSSLFSKITEKYLEKIFDDILLDRSPSLWPPIRRHYRRQYSGQGGDVMPRTGENIYRRRDGRWEARLLVGGVDGSKYRSLYASTYAEVKRKQRAAAAHQLVMLPTEPQRIMLFGRIAADWLAFVRLRVKISTYGKYERIVRLHIVPALGKQRIDRMTRVKIEQFAGGLIADGLAPKTAQDVLIVTKAILKYAKVTVDFSGITVKCDPKEMRVLSKSEKDALTKFLTQNADAVTLGVLLALYTGIRIGELCALRWENIDLTEKTLSIKNTMQRIPDFDGGEAKTKVVVTSPKSKCSVRTLPLPDFLIALLEPAAAHPKAFLLSGVSSRFIEPRTIQNRFKAYITACGIVDVNFHCLRHTFATRCVELGFDTKSLSEILGHSSVTITLERYVHSSLELKRVYMAKLKL
jgi:integrase